MIEKMVVVKQLSNAEQFKMCSNSQCKWLLLIPMKKAAGLNYYDNS